jgi:hypothetical protein
VKPESTREQIFELLVLGDNRLKQGAGAEKARDSWNKALTLAREAGLEESVGPLVEVRLAGLERLAPAEPPPAPPAA